MDHFPDRPFLTKEFSLDGGGIDYLGLRWVNLKLLGENLLPEVNNQTEDIGTFFLGAWIPWKFTEICRKSPNLFTEENYRSFREGIEVVIAHAIRDHSPSEIKFGRVRTRIGVEKGFPSTAQLSFKSAGRSDNNTLYSAPLYGPSLQYLSLLAGYAESEKGTATSIYFTCDDEATTAIVGEVEGALAHSAYNQAVQSAAIMGLDSARADDLGLNGLNPAFYRQASTAAKKAFGKKLLPSGNCRTLTARLIVETLRQLGSLNTNMLRAVWHTGMSPDGKSKVEPKDHVIQSHRKVWSAFQSRQIQRYFMEAFLCCFERSVKELKGGDFAENIDLLIKGFEITEPASMQSTFSFIIAQEIDKALGEKFEENISAGKAWESTVHASHASYDRFDYKGDGFDFRRALTSMARWWIRLNAAKDDDAVSAINEVGGTSRISAAVLHDWITDRLEMPLSEFCSDLISGMVFSQHLRIALSRMDGRAQRLRFTLGDQGIVATAKVTNFGTSSPPWMADRLDAFMSLLTDLDMVTSTGVGTFCLGQRADDYWV